MNFKTFLAVVIFVPLASYGQSTVVSTPNTSLLYIGLENPVKIAVNGIPCEKLMLVCRDSRITIEEKNCQYWVRPTIGGSIRFELLAKLDSSIVDTFNLTAVQVPDPVIRFHTSPDELGRYFIMDYIVVKNEVLDKFGVGYPIVKFELYAKRKRKVIFEIVNNGPSYNDETKRKIGELHLGDELFLGRVWLEIQGQSISYVVDKGIFIN